jgi:Mycothiol maleylpyruvate isomerase N-terminal domain
MPLDRSFLEQNTVQLARLHALIKRLGDEDLGRSVGGGWTVASALAHVAFWDRRAVVLLERWEREGVKPSEADSSAINEAALQQWLAIPPRQVAQMALANSEAAQRKLESVAPEILERNLAIGGGVDIMRGRHWSEHIDQIERALKG